MPGVDNIKTEQPPMRRFRHSELPAIDHSKEAKIA